MPRLEAEGELYVNKCRCMGVDGGAVTKPDAMATWGKFSRHGEGGVTSV